MQQRHAELSRIRHVQNRHVRSWIRGLTSCRSPGRGTSHPSMIAISKQFTDHRAMINSDHGPSGVIKEILGGIDAENMEDRVMNVAGAEWMLFR